MPNNHRGDFIAPNYRPTPRIAQLLVQKYDRSAKTGIYANMGTYAGYVAPTDFKSGITPAGGQSIIDQYRSSRDETRHQGRHPRPTGFINSIGSNIKEAVADRHVSDESFQNHLEERVSRDTGNPPKQGERDFKK